MDHESITHIITDRDSKFIQIQKSKEYVQPQWVYDCVNNAYLLPVKDYFPGKVKNIYFFLIYHYKFIEKNNFKALPPHLSPFVDNDKE